MNPDVPEPATDRAPDLERPPATGLDRVDAVLDAVAGLDEQPLDQHPRVFEVAHAELRASLDQRVDAAR